MSTKIRNPLLPSEKEKKKNQLMLFYHAVPKLVHTRGSILVNGKKNCMPDILKDCLGRTTRYKIAWSNSINKSTGPSLTVSRALGLHTISFLTSNPDVMSRASISPIERFRQIPIPVTKLDHFVCTCAILSEVSVFVIDR